MKKYFTGVLLGILSLSAGAQSSVTLYGVFDEGFTYVSNAGGNKSYAISSVGVSGSRWGLKGSEDLGGGMRAVFVLENGFDPTNGTLQQGGRMFGRQAFVGMSTDRYGTLLFGRQYDSVADNVGPLTPQGLWAGALFATPFDNDDTANSLRINNAIKYISPTIAGLSGDAMYAFSNAAGSFANNRMWAAGANYTYGPFKIAAAYALYDNPGLNTTATVNTGGALASDSVFIAGRQRIASTAANYTIGPATLGVFYSNTLVSNVGPTLTSGVSYHFNNFGANAYVKLNPALSVGLAYDFTTLDISGRSGGQTQTRYQQVSLQVDEFLSKRTDVYAEAIFQHAAGDAMASGLAGGAVAQIYANMPSSGQNQVLLRVAMRHRF